MLTAALLFVFQDLFTHKYFQAFWGCVLGMRFGSLYTLLADTDHSAVE